MQRSCGISKLIVLVVLLVVGGCRDEEERPGADVKEYGVVVLASEEDRWNLQETAEWCIQNIKRAQAGLDRQISLRVTFKNQADEDLTEYVNEIGKDDSVVAIIGPMKSIYAEEVAKALEESEKLMISPSATNFEYQRRFGGLDYVWNMAESDIAQIEMLLQKAQRYKYEEVVLLMKENGATTSDDSFADWLAYVAEEMDVQIGGVLKYRTVEELRGYVKEMCSEEDEKCDDRLLIFDPGSSLDIEVFDETLSREKNQALRDLHYPTILCTAAFYSEFSMMALGNNDYEGFTLYADPESGFGQALSERFDRELANGEAQFYDAMLLVSYALTYMEVHGGDIKSAMRAVVDGRDGDGRGWLPAEIARNYVRLREGQMPDLGGASGVWSFPDRSHTVGGNSYFKHWKKYDRGERVLEYISTNGSSRSSSLLNMWAWDTMKLQMFIEDTYVDKSYPELRGNWAVLIDGSKKYDDYRFQADIMEIYQLLKHYGYDDDHIIMITEDNIAYAAGHKEPGVVRTSPDGENVYNKEAIDYELSQLTPQDLADILAGRKSERLPKVLATDEHDNVFMFWSGHGMPGALYWGNSTIANRKISKALEEVRHRKMLIAVEACYSGGLGKECEGLPGTLVMTAASPYETSKTAVWNQKLQVYMTNGFTQGLKEALWKTPDISLRDLYYKLAKSTAGSHVKVYNEKEFGSVYKNEMGEWLNQ